MVALQSYHQDHHVKNLTSGLNEVFWKKLFILSGCEVVEEEQDLSGALLFNKKCAPQSTFNKPVPQKANTKGVQDLEDKSAILSETLFPICNGKLVVAKWKKRLVVAEQYLGLSGRGLKQEYLDSGHKSKWVLLTKLNANSAVFLRFILDVIVTLLKPLQMESENTWKRGVEYRCLNLMIIQPLFPSPNRVQLYWVVLTYWHPVRQWNTRTTQNRTLNESTKSIIFRKSSVRFALLFDWNICTRDIGNMLLLPGYCNIRDCWDLLQHFAGFLLSQPPGPARMLAVATPEKIKGNKSLLTYKYYPMLQFTNIRIFSYTLNKTKLG